MNKRQWKKWRKKHFVTILIPVLDINSIGKNMRQYSPDQMITLSVTFKTNPVLIQEDNDEN